MNFDPFMAEVDLKKKKTDIMIYIGFFKKSGFQFKNILI
jgi:hypothetical protein